MFRRYKSKDALETLVKLRDELDTLKECINGFQPLTNVSRPSWSGSMEYSAKKSTNIIDKVLRITLTFR